MPVIRLLSRQNARPRGAFWVGHENRQKMRQDQCLLRFHRLQERDIPEIKLSKRFVISTWKPGDECRWLEVVSKAFGDFISDWSAERFVERYVSSPIFKEDGFFFIRHKDNYIATAFAWQDEINTTVGRLHWLAVDPDYQRGGLGKALTMCVLRYHKDHGKTSVYLITEMYRHAAIGLYKNVGFTLCEDDKKEIVGS